MVKTNLALETVETPKISSTGLNCQTNYTLFAIDPDVVLNGTDIQTVILHWYQPHLFFECSSKDHPDDTFLRPGNETIAHDAPYIAAQPPPNSHHRYVFLLFVQPPSYKFPSCFSHIPPMTLQARLGFDLYEFMRAADLDPPVAINYFYGQNRASDDCAPTPSASGTTTSFRSVTCTTRPTEV
jgi:hypothetical protein